MFNDDRHDTADAEPQVPLPPYDDLRGDPGENTAPKAFDASSAPEPGPEASTTDGERSGVSSTDIEPEPALGVGASRGGRADIALDRDDVERRARAARSGRPTRTPKASVASRRR